MSPAKLKCAVAVVAMMAMGGSALAQEWVPSGPIRMMIAFNAGGGADTVGRLLAADLTERRGWQIIPENVGGRGGGTMSVELKDEPADGLSIGLSVDEVMTYNVLANPDAGYGMEDFTYLSTVTGTQMAIVARADKGWRTFGDVLEAAAGGATITFSTMTPRLTDATYIIGRNNGVEFTTVTTAGGLPGILAGDVDIGWVAGAQTPHVLSGDLVNLLSAEDRPLNASPDAPLISEFNVPYNFGSRFIVVAPAGVPENIQATYAAAIAEILNDPTSQLSTYVTRSFSGPMVVQGAELAESMRALYEASGLLIQDADK